MASLITCAKPYAKAAFAHAKAHHAIAKWETALITLTDIISHKDVHRVLSLPGVSADALSQLMIDLLGQQGDTAIHNFIKLLVEYEKLVLLPFIVTEFQIEKRKDEQCILVRLVSAQPMETAMTNKVISKLEARFQQQIELTQATDTALIGGIKIYIGDEVIDLSLLGQLKRLARDLKMVTIIEQNRKETSDAT